MKKFTKKQIQPLLENIRENFSTLIDAIIYFDSINKDEIALEIINYIDNLATQCEIDLLINDLINRNFEIETTLLYNSIWYGLNNNDEIRPDLVNSISNSEKKIELVSYLSTLDKGRERDVDLNIQKLLKEIKNQINTNNTLPKNS